MFKNPKTKEFDGTVFVEFGSADIAEAALAKGIKMGDTELEVQKKMDWQGGRRTRSKAAEGDAEESGKDSAKRARTAVEPIVSGTVLRVEGLPESGITWKNIKDAFDSFGDVKFVEYTAGETRCAAIVMQSLVQYLTRIQWLRSFL